MINKKIASEIAIGIIMITAITMGGLVLLKNKKAQEKISLSPTCTQAELGTSKGIVFLGDSITALVDWNELLDVACVTNLGIPGNTTEDVIARLSSAVASQPRKLFLMVGINDLLRGKEISHVMTNYEIILDEIRAKSPETMIYVQSVLPINNDILRSETASSEEIIALNAELKSIAERSKVFFMDLYPSFSGVDNKMPEKYAGDGLHPSSVGYEVWKKTIDAYVQ